MSDDEDEVSPGGVGREAMGFGSLTRPLSFRFLFCFLSLTMPDFFYGMIWQRTEMGGENTQEMVGDVQQIIYGAGTRHPGESQRRAILGD